MASASITALRANILAIDGVVESPSAFSEGEAFWIDAREIAHFDGDTRIEIRLTRKVISAMRQRLNGETGIERRAAASDWLIADTSERQLVVELVKIAADAHRPPPGTALRPPPEGADLARRRRFH